MPSRSATPRSSRRAWSGDDPDRPEVRGEPTSGEVGVGHLEVALLAPPGAPRVAHQEPLRRVVVADREDRVAAEQLLVRRGHRGDAGAGHLLAFEAAVDREPEHERETGGQATPELVELLDDPLVG